MIWPVVFGVVGIVVTVCLHALTTTWIAQLFSKHSDRWQKRWGSYSRSVGLAITSSILAVKHFVDITLWAIVYWQGYPQQFESFEDALYFSSVTYTALGYGDIVLTGTWRLMCGLQAMNGILLFGWSSAMLFLIVQRVWRDSDGSEKQLNL